VVCLYVFEIKTVGDTDCSLYNSIQ